ncbi:Hsp70 family protein [Streptomyces sp. ME02-6991-2A]|uniref:Hsp70 family protein n=1 Tax=Streptomyces sp. ME02-6991-2A TaxID=3028677 RepID=UPI0029B2E73C|nr:Hsp70 family protein [Streptomyces sp. ME02-6991-2A]MDX3378485.1 Hsp70 family protein [Streptomyces sp. ME02-6991-2A]
MLLSIDIGASSTKAAVLLDGDDGVVPVREQGRPEWPTGLLLHPDGALTTGQQAENTRKAPRFRGRYLTGLKQQVNLAGGVEPVHRELLFPSGESRPLLRGFAAVISHVLDIVREPYGAPRHVILSHPVMWSEQQRAVLAEAAVMAGCRSASLVGEAAAVGMFAARRRSGQLGEGTFAVFDLGASTFDFALLRAVPDGLPDVLYSAGRHVGGDDFDVRVLDVVRDGADEATRRLLDRLALDDPELLKSEAELLKRRLSTHDEVNFAVTDDAPPVTVHREDFADAVDDLVLACVSTARAAITSLPEDIPAALVLSGGGARTPVVREQVEELVHAVSRLRKDSGRSGEVALVDLTDDVEGSAVALGVHRRMRSTGKPPRPARPFPLTSAAIRLGDPGSEVVALPGGVLERGPDQRIRVLLSGNGDHDEGVLPVHEDRPAVTRIAADATTGRVVLAYPSPSFACTTTDASGGLRLGSVLGSFAALPTRPEGTVTAMARRGDLFAWSQTGRRGSTLVDDGARGWRPLPLREPVRELAFADDRTLLARVAGRIVHLDVRTGHRTGETPLPDSVPLVVGPAGLCCTLSDDELVGWAVTAEGLEQLWRRALRTGGAVAWTGGTGDRLVVAYDADAEVYRALDGESGRQVALRDAWRLPAPEALLPGAEPGVVHARRRTAGGTVLDRLQLAPGKP